MLRRAIAVALTACVGVGCSGGPSKSSNGLGDAVAAKVKPMLVPEKARLVGGDQYHAGLVYEVPAGISGQQIVDWYRAHMPPERDVKNFRYLSRRTDVPNGPLVAWTWCEPGFVPLTLSIVRGASIDGGRETIVITRPSEPDNPLREACSNQEEADDGS